MANLNPNRHAFVPYTGMSYIDTQGQQFKRRVKCDVDQRRPRTIVRSAESSVESGLNREIFHNILNGMYNQKLQHPCFPS